MKQPATKLFLVMMQVVLFAGCAPEPREGERPNQAKKRDYIRKIEGLNDTIPLSVANRGEVLIAYSDCYTCHTKDKRAKGPAFMDIARRYPANRQFIGMLAQRVINGGYGAWGTPVMSPHPGLSRQDAETMVSYILSLNAK